MNVLLTGANGYLGQHTSIQLQQAGHFVLPTNHDPNDWEEHLNSRAIDVVVHLSWLAKAGNGDPAGQRNSLRNTKRLLSAVDDQECRIIFASTASVYGPSEAMKKETDSLNPNCCYTRAKRLAEKWLAHSLPQEDVTVLRFGSLMGRGMTKTRTDLVVNAFAQLGHSGRIVEVWNPEAWKPIIHVKDAAGIIREAVEGRWEGVYNVASQCQQERLIANLVRLQTGCEVRLKKGDGQRSCRLDCVKLAQKLLAKGMPPVIWRSIPEAVREFS